jgi:hypothetical protein
VTTVVAWLALLVSGASLGWQIVVWKKTAARIEIELREGTTYHGDEEEERYVAVVAINVGRVATTVNEVGVTYYDVNMLTRKKKEKKRVYDHSWEGDTQDGDPPKRLEPGEELSMPFKIDFIWSAHLLDPAGKTQARGKVEIQGFVRIGSDILYSPRSITLKKTST